MHEEYVKNFAGQFFGILRYEDNGDVTAIDWASRMILGKYRKADDNTVDFYGRIVCRGNAAVSFIYEKHPELTKR